MQSSPFWKKQLANLLVLLMIPATTGITSAQSTASQSPMDGETIFRGLVLDDGPVAKLFPEIWQDPQVVAYVRLANQHSSKEQRAAARQKLVDLVRKQSPTFFDRFAAEMQSGDPVRVEAALGEMTNLLTKGVAPLVIPPPPDGGGGYSYEVNDVDVVNYVAAVTVVAVAVAAAVAVVVAAVVVVLAVFSPAGSSDATSHLRHDQLVNLITQRLATATTE
jgi:SdpC family antimicrobial peptide